MAAAERVVGNGLPEDTSRRLTSSQNSFLRLFTQRPRELIAGFLHRNTSLTADDLSKSQRYLAAMAGGVATIVNTCDIGLSPNARRIVAGLATILALLPDGIDGSKSKLEKEDRLAQVSDPETEQYSEFEIQRAVHGGGVDNRADGESETVMYFFEWLTARRRGDTPGQIATAEKARRSRKPSIARGIAEEKGIFVEETPIGWGILGTRLTRAAASVVVAMFPEHTSLINGAVAFSCEINYQDRLKIAEEGEVSPTPIKEEDRFKRAVAMRLAPIKIEDGRRIGKIADRVFIPLELASLI